MKHLRKFATEADVFVLDSPNVVLVEDTGKVLYNALPQNGVYIQHIDGRCFSTSKWTKKGFAKEEANGVAVITADCKFVMAKENVAEGEMAWGGDGKVITGIATTTAGLDAIVDFNGISNTSAILEQLSGYTDTTGEVGAPAAEACAAFVFPNGKRGYLPSMGEWRAAYKNTQDVQNAFSLISGGFPTTGYYWTSTQYDKNRAWNMYWTGGSVMYNNKSNLRLVKAFTTL